MLKRLLSLFIFIIGLFAAAEAQQRPNIIFILIDDLGWNDLGYSGSTFYETPNIDKLASAGMKFTNAYSACTVCSPSRAAILTGKYPARLHLTDWITGHKRPYAKLRPPDWTQYLPLSEVTLAEVLKTYGYTTASIGKWHLGHDEKYYPENQGFDLNIAGNFKGSPVSYFSPYKLERIQDGPDGEYLTDRQTSDAIDFIKQNRDKPFFLYLPYYTVHTPLQAKKVYEDYFKAKANAGNSRRNPVYAAMIKSLDENIGRLKEAVNETGLSKHTIIIFTSDNGGLTGGNPARPITSNLPLRAGKGSAYEGGVRVPAFFVWENKIQENTSNDSPLIGIDFFPTLIKIIDPKYKLAKDIDGKDLSGAVLRKDFVGRDALYWHYPHYHPGGSTTYSSIRQGDWKLIYFYETGKKELYNLKNDPGESNELSKSNTLLINKLYNKLINWKKSVKAQDPLSNPDYNKKPSGDG